MKIAAVVLIAAVTSMPTSDLLAQGTGSSDTPTAATPAPSPAAPAPVTSPASPTPSESPSPSAAASPSTDDEKSTNTPQKKVSAKKNRTPRQQELDRSIDNGTVPSRYRSQVPREYQKYIPFEK